MITDLSSICLKAEDSIRDALNIIDRNHCGIALVVDQDTRLIGTLTDGDLRRAILKGKALNRPVKELLPEKTDTPKTALEVDDRSVLLRLMRENLIKQVPILNKNRRVVGLVTIDELFPAEVSPVQAVIMAGGEGKRMRPLTNDTPKPMLKVGDRPVMQHIVEQLRESGVNRIHVTTHYKADIIRNHFGDGKDFGVLVDYVQEDRPLGTAGALGLMEKPDGPLLVVNGDVIAKVDYRSILAYHTENHAMATVAVRRYEVQLPYGVIDVESHHVVRIREKPVMEFFVNAGIYVLEPDVFALIPKDKKFDMTELIELLVEKKHDVVSYPVFEYWLDIGRPEDYARARDDHAEESV